MTGAVCLKLQRAGQVNLLTDPVWYVFTCPTCGRKAAGLVTCSTIWCCGCIEHCKRGDAMTYLAARRITGRHQMPKGLVIPVDLSEDDKRICRRLLVEEMDSLVGVF
jgi:hypothetical protein